MKLNSFLENKKNILNFFKNKKFDKVIKFGKKLLKNKKNDFQLNYVIGLSLVNIKNYIEAKKFFKHIITLNQTAENFYIYGNIQKQLNDFTGAAKSFEQAITINPTYSEAFNNLGNTKLKLDLIDEAVINYKKAIDANKKNFQAYFNLAHIYHEKKKFDDLKKLYLSILDLDSNNTTALNDLGYLNLIVGNIDEGRKLFEKVLNIDDKHIKAYKNYFLVTKISKENKFFKKLLNLNISNLGDADKAFIYGSLSKCYFDLNNKEFALRYLDKSNKIKISKSNFSIKEERKIFEKLKNFFNKRLIKLTSHSNKLLFTPIFILGMPRSGTTLLEQILSCHSNIHGAGELNYLPQIINKYELEKTENFDDFIKFLRSEYHRKVLQLSNKKFIIDKLPMNFRWIGFIVKAFPEAKIIHIQRNPMAICWSNYKINFPDPGMDFSLNQKNTAEYYILYDNLMKFWHSKLKDKIINIKYENFVKNHKDETKNLLEKIGLFWEDNLANLHHNSRPVETASLLQVRGDIKTNTSKEWLKYKDYLKIMQETLDSSKVDY